MAVPQRRIREHIWMSPNGVKAGERRPSWRSPVGRAAAARPPTGRVMSQQRLAAGGVLEALPAELRHAG